MEVGRGGQGREKREQSEIVGRKGNGRGRKGSGQEKRGGKGRTEEKVRRGTLLLSLSIKVSWNLNCCGYG